MHQISRNNGRHCLWNYLCLRHRVRCTPHPPSPIPRPRGEKITADRRKKECNAVGLFAAVLFGMQPCSMPRTNVLYFLHESREKISIFSVFVSASDAGMCCGYQLLTSPSFSTNNFYIYVQLSYFRLVLFLIQI